MGWFGSLRLDWGWGSLVCSLIACLCIVHVDVPAPPAVFLHVFLSLPVRALGLLGGQRERDRGWVIHWERAT